MPYSDTSCGRDERVDGLPPQANGSNDRPGFVLSPPELAATDQSSDPGARQPSRTT